MTIREARIKSGLSMRKAAMTLRIPYTTWQNWEYENSNPPEYIRNLILEELELLSKEQFVSEVSDLTFKELRLNLGLNRKDIADMIGMPTNTIQQWECGLNHPPEHIVNLVKRGLVRAYNRTHG